jgi:hypothetical protein
MDGIKKEDANYVSYLTLEELINSDVDWIDIDFEFYEAIEKMKMIDPDPKKVRCVFFFDN